jgi:uncharacterized membrane protein
MRRLGLEGIAMAMLMLVFGLVLFLGAHSTRIVAEGWRTETMAQVGEKPWKGVVTLLSIAGFALIAWGYALARQSPVVLWPQPPVWTRHLAALLTLVAFVLVAAAYVPRNAIKAKLHDPMILGVKVWALAHLIANNTLADVVLFGAFLLWAVFDFRAARKRRAAGRVGSPTPQPTPQEGEGGKTAVAVVVGVVAWAVFAFWVHRAWIGVSPMGV